MSCPVYGQVVLNYLLLIVRYLLRMTEILLKIPKDDPFIYKTLKRAFCTAFVDYEIIYQNVSMEYPVTQIVSAFSRNSLTVIYVCKTVITKIRLLLEQ